MTRRRIFAALSLGAALVAGCRVLGLWRADREIVKDGEHGPASFCHGCNPGTAP